MKKSVKLWLSIASSLTIFGASIFVTAMSFLDWDFNRLSTATSVTNNYEISEAFEHIFIDSSTADIEILPYSDQVCKITCSEHEDVKHKVFVENGVLNISEDDNRSWYEHFTITPFHSQKITILLPEKEYTSLKIDLSTGDVNAKKTPFKSIGIDLSTGDVALTDIVCEKINSESSTGDITLKRVIASKSFNLESSTGDISFIDSDAPSITVETSTGDVTGTLLTGKAFKTDTSAGSVSVPQSGSGGVCNVDTSTGDIDLKIK